MKQFLVQREDGHLVVDTTCEYGIYNYRPACFASFELALQRAEELMCSATVLELVPVAKVTYSRTVTRSVDPLVS